MDLLERYKLCVEDKMEPDQRRWIHWQEDLEYIKKEIRDIASEFIGQVDDDQNRVQFRYRLISCIRAKVAQGIITGYNVDEVNWNGLRVMVQFPGALDYRIISMRWS